MPLSVSSCKRKMKMNSSIIYIVFGKTTSYQQKEKFHSRSMMHGRSILLTQGWFGSQPNNRMKNFTQWQYNLKYNWNKSLQQTILGVGKAELERQQPLLGDKTPTLGKRLPGVNQ
jgi:hypothetical protein